MTELQIKILMLVTMWCSNPSHYRLNEKEVNECRRKLISCLENTAEAPINRPTPQSFYTDLKCFKDIKL